MSAAYGRYLSRAQNFGSGVSTRRVSTAGTLRERGGEAAVQLRAAARVHVHEIGPHRA